MIGEQDHRGLPASEPSLWDEDLLVYLLHRQRKPASGLTSWVPKRRDVDVFVQPLEDDGVVREDDNGGPRIGRDPAELGHHLVDKVYRIIEPVLPGAAGAVEHKDHVGRHRGLPAHELGAKQARANDRKPECYRDRQRRRRGRRGHRSHRQFGGRE